MIMQRVLYRFLRTLLALGLLCTLVSVPARAETQSVLVLGDSISAAYGMSLQQGWVALMARQLERDGREVEMINASISGETTSGALRRLPGLLEQHSPQVVLIELGGNDGLRGFPIRSFRDNLSALAGQSIEAGARVVILPMEIPPNYGTRYTAAFRESFPLVAENTGATLGSFPLANVATVDGMMQEDGIHPTVAAQPVLVENVLPGLLALLDAL